MNIPEQLTISIGIPAYNEEANIARLLDTLIAQHADTFILKEIIVVSDGSSDATVSRVRSIADPRIRVVDHRDRQGAALRENELLQSFQSDALVLLNADIAIKDPDFLAHFVAPYARDRASIGLVCPRALTLPGRNLFEQVLNFSAEMKNDLYERINGGDTIYLCRGVARVFGKEFARKCVLPAVIGEDAFTYLTAKQLGYRMVYAPDAVVYYRSPDTFRDHLRQSTRFFQARQGLAALFSSEVVAREHRFPIRLLLQNLIKFFFKNPFYFVAYTGILFVTKIAAGSGPATQVTWEMAGSTKTLE